MMEAILGFLTLSRIIGLFLFLASIWLIRIIIRNERRNFFRGMMMFLFFLLVMLYINQSDSSKLTVADVRDMIFPSQIQDLNYRVVAGVGSANHITTYYFDDPRPRLSVTLDNAGKYLHLKSPDSLNKVLKTMKLPEVEEGAQELVSITGSQLHTSLYRWERYPLGTLIVERAVQQNKETLESYHVIGNIQIRKRH
jgi:hypothetical protein